MGGSAVEEDRAAAGVEQFLDVLFLPFFFVFSPFSQQSNPRHSFTQHDRLPPLRRRRPLHRRLRRNHLPPFDRHRRRCCVHLETDRRLRRDSRYRCRRFRRLARFPRFRHRCQALEGERRRFLLWCDFPLFVSLLPTIHPPRSIMLIIYPSSSPTHSRIADPPSNRRFLL
jgi:hypothetical protein